MITSTNTCESPPDAPPTTITFRLPCSTTPFKLASSSPSLQSCVPLKSCLSTSPLPVDNPHPTSPIDADDSVHLAGHFNRSSQTTCRPLPTSSPAAPHSLSTIFISLSESRSISCIDEISPSINTLGVGSAPTPREFVARGTKASGTLSETPATSFLRLANTSCITPILRFIAVISPVTASITPSTRSLSNQP